ncbi:MAG: hypothetical protein ACRDLO_02465 [Solirubrobacterales bacterium]
MRRAAALALPLALLALVLSACGEREEPEIEASTTESQFEITGEWKGRLMQKGLQPFTVTATIVSLERSKQNVVRYTGIDCSGTWDYLGATATAYRFREVIDRGQGGKCKGVGTVALTPLIDDRVGYVFNGGGITSEGVLTRQR